MAKTKKAAPEAEVKLETQIKALRKRAENRDYTAAEVKDLAAWKKELGGLRFIRLATKRVPVALAKIKNVAGLAGKNYSCTQAQADYIVKQLADAVSELKQAFTGGTKSATAFQLPE